MLSIIRNTLQVPNPLASDRCSTPAGRPVGAAMAGSEREALRRIKRQDSSGGPTRSGLCPATFNFINSIVGAGIIGLPFALKQSGFFAGLFLLFFIGYVTDYSVLLIVRAGVKADKRDYEELCEHSFGAWGFYLCSGSMFIFAYGAMLVLCLCCVPTAHGLPPPG